MASLTDVTYITPSATTGVTSRPFHDGTPTFDSPPPRGAPTVNIHRGANWLTLLSLIWFSGLKRLPLTFPWYVGQAPGLGCAMSAKGIPDPVSAFAAGMGPVFEPASSRLRKASRSCNSPDVAS